MKTNIASVILLIISLSLVFASQNKVYGQEASRPSIPEGIGYEFVPEYPSVGFPLPAITYANNNVKDGSKKINIVKDELDSDTINEAVVFWGMDKAVTSDSFKGGEVTCVFGGGKLDLSNVKIAKDGATLEINCIFGGAEIILPKDINVVTNGTGVFGGWSPKISTSKSTGPRLEITGAAVFGGVEVRN